jgi:hypothetical protein
MQQLKIREHELSHQIAVSFKRKPCSPSLRFCLCGGSAKICAGELPGLKKAVDKTKTSMKTLQHVLGMCIEAVVNVPVPACARNL